MVSASSGKQPSCYLASIAWSTRERTAGHPFRDDKIRAGRCENRLSSPIHIPMPIPSFHEWLRSADEAPAAEKLATIIARSGAAGVSLDRLRRLCGLQPETLQHVIRSLLATGQVVVLKVDGQMVYKMAG